MDPEELEQAAETAGEEAARETEKAVKDAAADIAAELEEAEERAERAEETAEAIAEAALESERGRRINELENQVTTWRSEADHERMQRETLQMEMTSLRERLDRLETHQTPPSIPLAVTPEAPSLSDQVEEALEEVTDPAAAEIVVDAGDPEKPAEVRRKKRFLR